MDATLQQDPVTAGQPTHDESQRRLDAEIDRYKDCINVHDLPEMFHFWSNRYALPKLQACGFEGLDQFFTHYIEKACRLRPDITHRITSIGAGNCDLELNYARQLRQQDIHNYQFQCLEINPHMLDRGRRLAADENLASNFVFQLTDLDHWNPIEPVSVCIANHSLHHIVDLESLFEKIKTAIGHDGVFLTNDMIGRNGHMRWPEALVHVEAIWNRLPERYKLNHFKKNYDHEFVNFDCSESENEGIRAQDILPLLMEYFHFDSFITFANLIDIFVDRTYGHNFDANNPEDVKLIQEIAELDEAKLDSGEIKPTHLIAAMRTQPVERMRCYKHWTPEFAVRIPDESYRRGPQ